MRDLLLLLVFLRFIGEKFDDEQTRMQLMCEEYETIAQAHLFTASTFHLQTSGSLG